MPERAPLEREEAATLVTWLRLRGLPFTHVPNDTGHSAEAKRRAIRMKREGTSAGFPDYVILVPPALSIDGDGYLLTVELKRQGNLSKVSKEQHQWHDDINALGVNNIQAYICKGADAAIKILSQYLRSPDRVEF